MNYSALFTSFCGMLHTIVPKMQVILEIATTIGQGFGAVTEMHASLKLIRRALLHRVNFADLLIWSRTHVT